MSGSEIVRKDVLEYVVFEKHISHQYGNWRLHAKIIPPWAPPREFGERTYVNQPVKSDEDEEEKVEDKEEAVSTVTSEAKTLAEMERNTYKNGQFA